MTANADLAIRARQLAAKAPNGSLERRALACASIALSTTTTIAAARRVLAEVGQADVQLAALAVLEQLAGSDPPGGKTMRSKTDEDVAADFRAVQRHIRQAAVDALVLEAVDVLARGLLGEDWRRRYGRSSGPGEWIVRPRRVA
jgi:hypothetical protein